MVGPASEDEKREGMRRLKFGVVALVGASAGLIVVSRGATPLQILLAVAAGSVIGRLLVAYLFWIA